MMHYLFISERQSSPIRQRLKQRYLTNDPIIIGSDRIAQNFNSDTIHNMRGRNKK